MADKKIPFQGVLRTYDSLLSQGELAATIFSERKAKHEFFVEESEEGERRILQHMGKGVMRYVSETMLINTLITFSSRLPEVEFKSYLLDAEKARKVAKYWIGSQVPFPHKIFPILQKSTKGYCFHRLDFDMQQEKTGLWDYLCEALDTNKEAFKAYLGAMFDPSAQVQQFLWIAGSGGDGKGALLRLIAKIFAQSYTSISTDSKHIDKYWQSSLVGKRVAVCGDTKNLDFVNSSIFMQVTGGDYVTVRPMYEKAYTTKLDCMFIFAANAQPNSGSENSAKRRAIIVELDRDKYKHFDDFEQRLWGERAGIVQDCLDEWKKVKKLREIPVDMEKLEDLSGQVEERWEYLTERYFEIDEGGEIDATTVITILEEGEKRPPNNMQMGEWKRYLKRTYGVENKKVRVEGTRNRFKRVFAGMKEKGADASMQGLRQVY